MKSYGATVSDIRGLSCSTTTGGVKRKLCPANGGDLKLYWNIWEPNHTLHTAAVSNYFNNICKQRDSNGNYTTTPCTALSSTTQTFPIYASIGASDNVDIYDGLNGYVSDICDAVGPGGIVYLTGKLKDLYTYKTPGSADSYTESNQLFKLAGNSTTRVRVYVWLEGQDPDNYDIITGDNNISVKFGFTKDRYDLESQYVYTIHRYNGTYIGLNQPIPSSERTYSNFAAAKSEFGYPAAIAHETENRIVKASYVAFERNNKVYYLKGGINEYSAVEKTVYNQNLEVMKEAFGSNWQSVCTESISSFSCSADGFYARADTNGTVGAGGDDWYCKVIGAGDATCHF